MAARWTSTVMPRPAATAPRSKIYTPSFTTDSTKTACLSINGGTSALVQFNQNPGGDFGDFAPAGADIQSAFGCCGSIFTYTTASPEYVMMEAIGWDPFTATSVPEPASLLLLGTGLFRDTGVAPPIRQVELRVKFCWPVTSLTRRNGAVEQSREGNRIGEASFVPRRAATC